MHRATISRSEVSRLPVGSSLCLLSCSDALGLFLGPSSPNCPQTGQAPRLAAMAPDVEADEHVQRPRTQAVWLSASGLPRPKALVANGKIDAKLTTGPPDHSLILSNITRLGSALPACLSLCRHGRDTCQGVAQGTSCQVHKGESVTFGGKEAATVCHYQSVPNPGPDSSLLPASPLCETRPSPRHSNRAAPMA